MKIKISDELNIREIQEAFHSQFAFLKIEFFHISNSVFPILKKPITINQETKIGAARSIHSGEIDIEPQQTVSEIKSIFREKYGLSIQISRKSGNAWIPSTTTDSWTLFEQNKQGEMLSSG